MRRRLIVCRLTLCLIATRGAAIVIRHDRTDSLYRAAGGPIRAVCMVGRAGDATLISPTWALTAAHVVSGMRRERPVVTLNCSGHEVSIRRVVPHPDWRDMGPHDLALLELDEDVGAFGPIPLLPEGSIELGATATLVGHGATKTGQGGSWVEDRQRRAATSVIDRVDDQWLHFSFDAAPGGTDLEGAPGRGDSGGPALIEVEGKRFVAGVSSLGTDGMAGPGTYGAGDLFGRISTHRRWLWSVMGESTPKLRAKR